MKFFADLHIHSRFSRATSKSLDFVALHRFALEKGIGLVGTGDFTHPGWMAEIETQLEPAEEGLFRLKSEFKKAAEEGLPAACSGDVRFVLQVEISNIYKKNECTRKNHNLVFAPSLEVAMSISKSLSSIGNVTSDGRPILGLDAKDLLEITLESSPLSFLVPAHIWTPWFSLLGSKSGFDSIEACFEDLSEHIFAVETGLSSDPLMNWRVAGLDHLTLISNSDAHSPQKLGREANILDIEMGYEPLLNALKTREGFLGTIEFYPEEGKYHLDGHRKCDLRLTPEETIELGGVCPKCGGKITVGVMNRVAELATRETGVKPSGAAPFKNLVSLRGAIGEVLGVGESSKRVSTALQKLLANLGPELTILGEIPLEEIESVAGVPMREVIGRIRRGDLSIEAGYDGEFGRVKVFKPGEREQLLGQKTLAGFEPPRRSVSKKKREAPSLKKRLKAKKTKLKNKQRGVTKHLPGIDPDDPLAGLNDDQVSAATTLKGPLLISAGPGTGKTHTIVSRIAHQVRQGSVKSHEVLAISFTNQAVLELKERLAKALENSLNDASPFVGTFHSFALHILKTHTEGVPQIADEETLSAIAREILGSEAKAKEVSRLLSDISRVKSFGRKEALVKDAEFEKQMEAYQAKLEQRGEMDLDDLLFRAKELLFHEPAIAQKVRDQYKSVSVDEYQDVNDVQAKIVALIADYGESICVIGDPDQSIYGFRGAQPSHFEQFKKRFIGAKHVVLKTTYRLPGPILEVARSVLTPHAPLTTKREGPRVEVVTCPTPKAEAEQIVVRLEALLGGTSHFAVDSGRAGDGEMGHEGFGDVAILSRTKAQRSEILKALERSGIPSLAVGEDDPHDPRAQKVAVMTMHASKGREFETVFVTGLEQGLVPLQMDMFQTDIDEERRLLYVAITRAKRQLVLSFAQKRHLFGNALSGPRSPFLDNLPAAAVREITPKFKKRLEIEQMKLF